MKSTVCEFIYINTIKIIYQHIVFFIDIYPNILHKLSTTVLRLFRQPILVQNFKKG